MVNVTPPGGRTATLSVRKRDHLIDRAIIPRQTWIETIRYSDYRRITGMTLPFRIEVNNGDEPESGIVSVTAYRTVAEPPANAFDMPKPPTDVSFISHTTETKVPLRVDPRSGFPIVFAQLNAGPLMPFILDTGGHDIVTPEAARRLGLRLIGAGQSYGAGAGSTQTRFTTVRSLTIGGATLAHQPLTVLYIDLGHTRNAQGNLVPVAGILGLEVFERFAVTLDFDRHQVTFRRPSVVRWLREPVRLRFTSDMPLVTAAASAASGNFGVDTGNNTKLILFSPWLRSRRVTFRATRSSMMSGSSVGGTMALQPAYVDHFTLGGISLSGVPVLISTMTSGSLSSRDEAGNIGLTILERFRRVIFDYAAGGMEVGRL